MTSAGRYGRAQSSVKSYSPNRGAIEASDPQRAGDPSDNNTSGRDQTAVSGQTNQSNRGHHSNYDYNHNYNWRKDFDDHHHYYDWNCNRHYYYYQNYWTVYPPYYYSRCRSNSFFFFVDLGAYETRYIPTYVREYQVTYYNEAQPVDIYEASDSLSRAYAAFAREDYYSAITHFDRAVREHPKDGLLYFARAQAFFAVSDYRNAYEDILTGMDLIPDWPKINLNLTEVYSDPAAFDDQLDALSRRIQDRPDDYKAEFVLGYTYFFLQNYVRAREMFERVLDARPGHRAATDFLGRIDEIERELDKK